MLSGVPLVVPRRLRQGLIRAVHCSLYPRRSPFAPRTSQLTSHLLQGQSQEIGHLFGCVRTRDESSSPHHYFHSSTISAHIGILSPILLELRLPNDEKTTTQKKFEK